MKLGKYGKYKEKVIKYAQLMLAGGYTAGTGGNVSVLIEGEDAVAVTPSDRDYMELAPEDICVVNFDGAPLEGKLKPSIETGMHIAVYRNRPDVNAVIHTHQVFASVFALLNRPVPALFDEAVANMGDVVEVIPYALSGSPELAANVAGKLANRCNCYIIQNHGALCLGVSIEKAFRNVELLEKCARVYYCALAAGGEITTLPQSAVDHFLQILRREQDREVERKSGIRDL
ncbi:MAG: class II aldolase/adducin family protein [Bacillota bacterium]